MKNTEQLDNDPPLRAVRTFEAFARHGGVNSAARELDVSPSAVSHQLRLLETFLRQPLTARQGRNLILTDEGREYYRAIRSAFAVLRSATDHVREKSVMRQVTISLIPLFGINLFIPRLAEFLQENPGLDINVTYANHRSYPSDAADISIRFGTGHWPGYHSELLISGAVGAYCSRDFAEWHSPIATPEALSELPLLHDEERGTWAQWFAAAEVKHPAALNGLLFEDGQLALTATLTGLGCSLLREPLVAPHVASGELVKLFDLTVDDGRAYYLCRRADSELSREGLNLYSWVKRSHQYLGG
ncbi:LysR substrate-binding domain-containing protein [Pseudomonas sp. CCI3.2]|uniref:LysR substrate-binding domain-containing protein n=1 Tax=unclassified Pseudomonas TaxID=196821 RepID=UPI002AC97201|nr:MULTISPECIES: LysR substrate-binding domain-containing protein [unclassified Pseudomonas]MEB0078756.1 LysR substrate-binding domain-containing protein [Pseudomonas sp. MH10out]MEB0093508.1 LysR substrate-binding domain-containing protein [Pseudomonas sp. CCI4.2]MEB0100424.1 LysR substrate-binding domain-containing protein [Pseudomonas sp. CCI3.2]MEB0129552.1 LysR substrate-binding domain-containing protein [Pseudomonas sp. CCI2.4]MEB0157372.1 LysR substrate-binding domain-containing protein